MLRRRTPLKATKGLASSPQLSSGKGAERKSTLKATTSLKATPSLRSTSSLKSKSTVTFMPGSRLKVNGPKRKRLVAKRREPIPKLVLDIVKDRSRGYCEWCWHTRGLRVLVPERMEPHHVVFRSQGGKHVPECLIALCVRCHYGPEGPHHSGTVRCAMERLMAAIYRMPHDEWREVAAGKRNGLHAYLGVVYRKGA